MITEQSVFFGDGKKVDFIVGYEKIFEEYERRKGMADIEILKSRYFVDQYYNVLH